MLPFAPPLKETLFMSPYCIILYEKLHVIVQLKWCLVFFHISRVCLECMEFNCAQLQQNKTIRALYYTEFSCTNATRCTTLFLAYMTYMYVPLPVFLHRVKHNHFLCPNHLPPQTYIPLATVLLAISEQTFFLNNWHVFLTHSLIPNLRVRSESTTNTIL